MPHVARVSVCSVREARETDTSSRTWTCLDVRVWALGVSPPQLVDGAKQILWISYHYQLDARDSRTQEFGE